MPRRNHRKKQSVLGTLFIELSALAGILGISQPTLRDNLWTFIQGPASVHQSAPQSFFHSSATKFQSLPEKALFETAERQASLPQPQTHGVLWGQPRGFE